MRGSGLTIRARRAQGCVIATIAGEVDIATVALLRERLSTMTVAGSHVVVDLDRVSFIDAAGLGALVGAASQAAAHGGTLRVVCARPRIQRLFRLTDLDRHLRLASTLAEARQALTVEETPAGITPADASVIPADLRLHLPVV